MSTLWLVPRTTPGIQPGSYLGLGLRGNDSAPIRAEAAVVADPIMLGPDGSGFDTMMGIVLPLFNLCNAACSVGLTEAALTRAITHVSSTRYQHMDSSLAELPTIRAYLARAKIQADSTRMLWEDAIAAHEGGRPDTMLRVLQVKAAANEAAIAVTQECMRTCGGAAYRPEVGIERYFRDARAGFVMAPTSDQLYDFIGKAITGLPLF
jgi:alkylation response protein AidB-like acyl-CoA dehydrogenase